MAPATKKISKNKLGRTITEIGSALFVSAPNPSPFDEKQMEAGIVLSAESLAILTAQVEKMLDDCTETLVADRSLLVLNAKPQVDKEGNLTGDFLIKSKTGIAYPPSYVDVKNKTFVPAANFTIPNRSKIRLAISVETYKSSTSQGITLKLNGIKIISLTPAANAFGGLDDEGDFGYDEAPVVAEAAVDWAD